MKIKCYTLVEILMVVGIIAILVGLAIPVLNSARATAKLNKAAAECNSIALAIKNFEAEYGQMPNPGNSGEDAALKAPSANTKDSDNNNVLYSPTKNELSTGSNMIDLSAAKGEEYRTFFSMMIGYCYSDPSTKTKSTPSTKHEAEGFHNNSKQIRFLDAPASYKKAKTSIDPTTEGYIDPWGKPYMILYRVDGDINTQFKTYTDGNGGSNPEIKILSPVVVYTVEGSYKSSADYTKSHRYATSWNGVITKPE